MITLIDNILQKTKPNSYYTNLVYELHQPIKKINVNEKINSNVIEKINEFKNVNEKINEKINEKKLLYININPKMKYLQCYNTFNLNPNSDIKHMGGYNTILQDLQFLNVLNFKINLQNEMKLTKKLIDHYSCIYEILEILEKNER